MNKLYTLQNGYKIGTDEFYDGVKSEIRWCIYKPNGLLYVSCDSYDRAYEIARRGTI